MHAGKIAVCVPFGIALYERSMTRQFSFGRRPAVVAFALLFFSSFQAFATSSSTSTAPTNLVITTGGTYSGNWASNDPAVPAVYVNTDQPVTIQNATVTGRGDLIVVNGNYGAHVTVQNVTGTALDPGVRGAQRGSFVRATKAVALQVTHCSMYGVSFGVQVLYSTMQSLSVSANVASELEDRASDGQGGLLVSRPSLGHFVMLNQVVAPAADISWNQVVDTVGQSSTEDVINLYKAQGLPGSPIRVHDNYLEGYSSTTSPQYTGVGIITDGDGKLPDTANVVIASNEMVHAAGSGIEIATGSNIAVTQNRVVSCGVDSAGNWIAMPFVNAIVVWNYYGSLAMVNDTVQGTFGGMVRPSDTGAPEVADIWSRSSDLNATDTLGPNQFTDPCLVNGQLNLNAEATERAYWQTKLKAARISPGTMH